MIGERLGAAVGVGLAVVGAAGRVDVVGAGELTGVETAVVGATVGAIAVVFPTTTGAIGAETVGAGVGVTGGGGWEAKLEEDSLVGAGEVWGPTAAVLIGAACSIGPTCPAAPVVGFMEDAPEFPLLSASVGAVEKIVSPVSAGSAKNEF